MYGWLLSLPVALFLTMRYIGSKKRLIYQQRYDSYAMMFTNGRSAFIWAIIAGVILVPIWPISLLIAMGLDSGRKADIKNQELQKQLASQQELNRQLVAESKAQEAAHQAEVRKIMEEEGWDKIPGLTP